MHRAASVSCFLLWAVVSLSGAGDCRAADDGLRWRLGPDDFAHYGIEVLERRDSKMDGYARWGQIDDIAGFHGYELDEARRRVTREVTHAQLLYTPFVFTLPSRTTKGASFQFREVRRATWRMCAYKARGEVRVTKGTEETSDGRVVLEGAVEFVDARKDALRYRRLLSGRLTWTTRFDVERGLVESVDYDLSWNTEEGTKERPRSVHAVGGEARVVHERIRLTLDRVLTHRYAGFQRDVDRAIEDGLVFIESRQREDGSFGNSGSSVLALLALVDGGRGAEDASVKRGFAWLLSQSPWTGPLRKKSTYWIGVATMAVERRRTPPAEIERRRRGLSAGFLPRDLTCVERAWMTRCVGHLIDEAVILRPGGGRSPATGEATKERWSWRYGRGTGRGWDNSNTQYAVLGLESAARCGIAVPGRAWLGIANHFLEVQAPSGQESRDLVLVRHGEKRRRARWGTTTPTRSRAATRAWPRGWCYGKMPVADPGTPPTGWTYGSMTTAGIASLAIARSRIERARHAKHHAELLERIDQGILDGYASLDDMFDVWTHPRYEGWYTYYLYGLERAGMLTSVERFGGHDWYWEGAVQLLLRRSTYGQGEHRYWSYDFGGVGTTAWAILFLKRGTPPVITPP